MVLGLCVCACVCVCVSVFTLVPTSLVYTWKSKVHVNLYLNESLNTSSYLLELEVEASDPFGFLNRLHFAQLVYIVQASLGSLNGP